MSQRGIRAVVLLLFVCAGAGAARAEEDIEALIRQGNALRKQGESARAYGYFKRAYDSAHTPRTAAQLGLVEQSLGRHDDAEVHFSEALAGTDPWVEQNRAALEDSRRKVRGNLGRIDIQDAPAGTTVAIGMRAAIAVPADGTLWAKPGDTSIRISAPGRETVVRNVSVSMGANVRVELPAPSPTAAKRETPAPPKDTSTTGVLEPPPSSAPPAPPMAATPASSPDATNPGGTLQLAGVVAAGVGAAAGIAGVFVYRAGAAKRDAIADDATNKRQYDPANGNYKTLGDAGIAMMIGGGAVVVAGAVLYLLGRNQRGEAIDTGPSHAAIDIPPGGGFCIRLSGRF